jgi:hypothetical protein
MTKHLPPTMTDIHHLIALCQSITPEIYEHVTKGRITLKIPSPELHLLVEGCIMYGYAQVLAYPPSKQFDFVNREYDKLRKEVDARRRKSA